MSLLESLRTRPPACRSPVAGVGEAGPVREATSGCSQCDSYLRQGQAAQRHIQDVQRQERKGSVALCLQFDRSSVYEW